jgi:xanthine dehydrogenase YagS FAD-binding subunit
MYHRASSREEAASRLGDAGALPLGGGTDLLVFIDEGLARPSALVDLRDVPGFRDIVSLGDATDGLRLGAGARIDDLANDALVRARYPALAEACAAVGTPALRQMGTLGGNLCQRPRCWYFRRAIPCWKNGGTSCPAEQGENQHLAIVDGGPCYAVHPSDPAVALVALDGVIEVTGARTGGGGGGGVATRSIPAAEFFVLPTQRLDRETNLAPGEFVSAVILPGKSAAGLVTVHRYYKEMQRTVWDFALVSLAAVKRGDGDVRLVLGGVAPRPWRVMRSVEERVASGGLDEAMIKTLSEEALRTAQPLSQNGYKVRVAAALLARGIRELTA